MKVNKIFLMCILSLSMVFGSFAPAYAQESALTITDASGNPVSGSVSSSSATYAVGSANPGEIVMVSVLKPMEEGTVLSDSNLGLHLYWADDMVVPSNGDYSFPLDFSLCPTGDYTIRVSFSSSHGTLSIIQSVINEEDRDAAIRAINSAADVNAVKNVFVNSDGARDLSLNVSAYNRLNDSSKTAVFDAVFEYKSTTPLTVGNLSDFNTNVFVPACALALYNQTNSVDVINEFSTCFKLLENTYTNTTNGKISTEQLKSAALSAICTSDYSAIADMQKAYSTSVCLYAIYSAPWQNFDGIVGDNSYLFDGMQYATYTGLKSKSPVALEVSGKLYGSKEAFVAAFNASVQKQYLAEQNTSTGVPSRPSVNDSSSSVGVGGGGIVSPQLPTFEDPSFNDLAGYDWAKEAIEYLFAKGHVSGVAKNTFAPQNTVKREEFIKMLVLILNKYDANASCNFADVPVDNWSYSYVASAFNANLVKGIDNNNFGIGNEISRQDACVLLYRAISDKLADGTAKEFTDGNEISDYAKEAVNAVSAMGLVNGMEDGSFKPTNVMTRAEAAKLLYELCKVIGG